MGNAVDCDVATVQEPDFPLGTPPEFQSLYVSPMLQLKLRKLSEKARMAFRVKDAPHKLVAVAELIDAECGVYSHRTDFDIEYNGEIMHRGWRDTESKSRLW